MSAAERIDLTRLTRAMVRSSNLSVGLFVLLVVIYIVMVPLAVAIPGYGRPQPRFIDLLIIIAPAAIALLILYPAAYYLVCVWRIAVITELVAIGFGFFVTWPVDSAIPIFFQFEYKAAQLTPEAYWDQVFPGFWGNATILAAIDSGWIISVVIGVALASPFIRAAWRFKRARSYLLRHGINLAFQPWRRPGFRAQMRALSWPRSVAALGLFWAGIIAVQAVPMAVLGVFGGDTVARIGTCLAVIVGSILLLRAGHGQMLETRRQAMLGLGQILATDERAPVLFLRSFSDDHIQLRSRRKPMLWPLALRRLGAEDSFEEALTIAVTELGPVIAIGRPGEQEYVSDETWQQRVDELISRASLIVVLIGNTKGLAWEAARLLMPGSRDKVLFVVPPQSNAEANQRWQLMRRQIAEGGGEVTDLPETVEDVLAWSVGHSGTRTYCAARRSQDTYELALLIAGHEVQNGRIPMKVLAETL